MPARSRATSGPIAPGGAGSRGYRQEGVSDIQRARMIAAMIELAAGRGIANISVAHVVERAGVSRRTFYELFTDREDCFLAAFEEVVATAREELHGTYDPRAGWAQGIRAALAALLAFLDAEPALARVLVVESLGAGPRVLAHRGEVLSELAAIADRGREQGRTAGAPLSPLTAEAVVGGVLAVLYARICDGEGPLIDLAGPLMSLIALPYLGAAAARRELQREPSPVSPRRVVAPSPSTDPLRELPMRLTYRTVRVLQAIAAHPGASNRAVGIEAGIEDQGQASKLLTRLERIGLIVNAHDPTRRGSPNHWTLSDRGAALLRIAGRPHDRERWYRATRNGS